VVKAALSAAPRKSLFKKLHHEMEFFLNQNLEVDA